MGRIKRSLADIEKTCSPKNLALLKAEVDVFSKAGGASSASSSAPSKPKKGKAKPAKSKGAKAKGSAGKKSAKSAAFVEKAGCACPRFREIASASNAAKLKSAYDKIKKACDAKKVQPISKEVAELAKKAAAVRQAEEQKATAIKPGPSPDVLHRKMKKAWSKIKRLNAAELDRNKKFFETQAEALDEAKETQRQKLEDYATKIGEHEETAADKFKERMIADTKKWDAILDKSAETKDRDVMDKQKRLHKLDIEGAKDDERTVERDLTDSVTEQFQSALAKKDAAREEAEAAEKEAREERKAAQKEWVKAQEEKAEERVEKRCAKHKNKNKRKSCETKRRAREMYKITQKEAQKFN